MSIRVAIDHRTTYTFDRPVSATPHTIRLRPAPHTRTPILGYSLVVDPGDHFLNWIQDPYGNFAARVVFPEPIDHLDVTVEVLADLTPINPFDFFLEPDAETSPFTYPEALAADLTPYLGTVASPLLDEYVAAVDRRETKTMDFLVELNQGLRDRVDYEIRMEPGVLTPDQTLERARGSCRDSGWLLVQLLRRLGLAARFVSGYLVQLQPDVEALDGPSGPTVDFTDLHAWAEVYLPGAGWVGLDPTSGLLASEGHIPLAATPSPGNAAPIEGATSPCEVEFGYHNEVRRVFESPRSTRPYLQGQWEEIDALGAIVDRALRTGDVRLTTGGEPTFVAVEDRDADEWNTAADGPAKRRLAADLTTRLRERYAAGGFLHCGQGKWYPGEPLPRWAMTLYWRADGAEVWPRPELLAPLDADETGTEGDSDGADPDPEGPDTDGPAADAPWRLALVLADLLGAARELVLPAYEDPLYHLWQEANLPPDVASDDVDPERADLDEVGYRHRLARVLSRGLRIPTGYVLPLAWDGAGWATSAWQLRRDRLFLVPGDSPVGYRLPLDRLPVHPDGVEPGLPADALAPRDALPDVPAPARAATVDVPVRTAIAVELRGGVVHVFLPPVEDLEAYLGLVRVVHDAASALDTPVRIEGYQPPGDPRLRSLSVTPDPGVVEVNLPPVAGWDETVALTTELYDLAHQCRLSAEKFDLDGVRVGTGGGNHITIGGRTPAESPLLRRPDLLRSMITYWQHHPGLSYLFAGSFIGPTSQAPRVDEARHESLDELELAFDELERQGEAPPWIVDRLLRHLLVDITGNTHRAEFCIDKLFPPGFGERRLGIVELRGFEMPPHPEMSLVQQLLLRALIARFWADPYEGELVRWGARLHDQFLLPHFVAADLADVCADLARHGFPFDPGWLEPFVEFRFPRIGDVQLDGVTIELRRALEPWPVLGEEMTAGGTARAVDSSLERLQVEVVGAVPDRHVVLCNHEPLVLHHAGTDGRLVGGVRYRAWNPPSSLHPTIDVQSPLVFDLVDTWAGEIVGGCQYHVVHPGGLAYEHLPVNAEEAAGRRGNRFLDFGHTPAAAAPVRPGFAVSPTAGRRSSFLPVGSGAGPLSGRVRSPKGPGYTLDLRRTSYRSG